MTKEPNLLDDVVYAETLAQAETLGKAHVAAIKAQRMRQQQAIEDSK